MTNEQGGSNYRWENNDSPIGVICKEGGDANSELPPFGMECRSTGVGGI